jgi:hypothetical protein
MIKGILRFSIIIFSVYCLISCSQSTQDSKDNLLLHLVEDVSVNNHIVIDFINQYLEKYKDTPVVVCHVDSEIDTLILTLSGYYSYATVYNTPIGYLKLNERIVLFDLGVSLMIDRETSYKVLLEKIHENPSKIKMTEEDKLTTPFYPSWQIKIWNDDNYYVKKGVKPPGSPVHLFPNY